MDPVKLGLVRKGQKLGGRLGFFVRNFCSASNKHLKRHTPYHGLEVGFVRVLPEAGDLPGGRHLDAESGVSPGQARKRELRNLKSWLGGKTFDGNANSPKENSSRVIYI